MMMKTDLCQEMLERNANSIYFNRTHVQISRLQELGKSITAIQEVKSVPGPRSQVSSATSAPCSPSDTSGCRRLHIAQLSGNVGAVPLTGHSALRHQQELQPHTAWHSAPPEPPGATSGCISAARHYERRQNRHQTDHQQPESNPCRVLQLQPKLSSAWQQSPVQEVPQWHLPIARRRDQV